MKLSYIKFRCTEEEKAAILKKAGQAGATVSEYCRRQALDGRIYEAPKLSSAHAQYLHALTTCHHNFTRIANYMRNKSPELEEEIRKFLGDFKMLFYLFFPKK